MARLNRRAVLFASLALTAGLAGPVLAHHGWSWTDSGFFELTGIITEIDYGNPHPTLDVDVEGTVWRVELAPPGASTAAGFTEETASVGDEVTAIGNRSQDPNEMRMKAVRVIIDGTNYDVYPDRAADI
ncbi:DUF6152 family protein [Devosia nitrariae]|uniref:DUF5666 domain-containing protein n=1 Tax=Devosia nitrariae TaxID=2071872 RepID=A0ABQ5W1Y9_9HYPH|nr:DUF6152 family protein [Devosia nitrariae]GLQ53731.1 hypothetical protein GCM10010862_09900 [Devosia nitrariae]